MGDEFSPDEDDEVDDDAGCEFCVHIEEAIEDNAGQYKAKGWDPHAEGGDYRYGFTVSCECCGRSFDLDAADAAYAATPGPDEPTGSPADEARELAGRLGVDAAGFDELLRVFLRRPMRG